MKLLDDLLAALLNGEIIDLRIGLHWTAVIARVKGERRCGLASTLAGEHKPGTPNLPQAGQLHTLSGAEMAALARSKQPTPACVGVAAINALIPPRPELWTEQNAEEVIAHYGKGKAVALIGHFPFVTRLQPRVGRLIVFERRPQEGDLPEEAAPDHLPGSDVVAITAMTLANHSLEKLLALCSPQALILLLGPSTPLTPLMYEYGIDLLSGSFVEQIEPVMRAVEQGANFRQVHRAGVRLVTMCRPNLERRKM